MFHAKRLSYLYLALCSSTLSGHPLNWSSWKLVVGICRNQECEGYSDNALNWVQNLPCGDDSYKPFYGSIEDGWLLGLPHDSFSHVWFQTTLPSQLRVAIGWIVRSQKSAKISEEHSEQRNTLVDILKQNGRRVESMETGDGTSENVNANNGTREWQSLRPPPKWQILRQATESAMSFSPGKLVMSNSVISACWEAGGQSWAHEAHLQVPSVTNSLLLKIAIDSGFSHWKWWVSITRGWVFYGPDLSSFRLVLHPGIESGSDPWGVRRIH